MQAYVVAVQASSGSSTSGSVSSKTIKKVKKAKSSAPVRQKKVVPVHFKKEAAPARSAVKRPATVVVKENKKLVPVDFSSTVSESDLEPLDKSVVEASKKVKKQKTKSEIQNQTAKKRDRKQRGKGIKMNAGVEVVQSPDAAAASGREVAAVEAVVIQGPPAPFVGKAVDSALDDLKNATDLEMLEYE